MTKCGVDPAQAWNDYGRLTLAERQLDLARRARVIHFKKAYLKHCQPAFKPLVDDKNKMTTV